MVLRRSNHCQSPSLALKDYIEGDINLAMIGTIAFDKNQFSCGPSIYLSLFKVIYERFGWDQCSKLKPSYEFQFEGL